MERVRFYGTDMEKQLKAEDGKEHSKKPLAPYPEKKADSNGKIRGNGSKKTH